LQSLATAFRDALPSNGAAALVSEGVDSARSYLGERDVRDIGTDAVDLVRRHPVQAILFGAGFGWLFARWTNRRLRRATEGSRLKDVMTRHVEVIRPDATLRDAANKMADLDVGVMPVCDGDRLVGVLTDRDITIRAIARGADASSPVREIMSTSVRYAFEDEAIATARDAMKRHKIRRLPVLDSNRRLVGIVSLGDLAVERDIKDAGDVLERVSAASPTH
jgi:CBS domain-containing protein